MASTKKIALTTISAPGRRASSLFGAPSAVAKKAVAKEFVDKKTSAGSKKSVAKKAVAPAKKAAPKKASGAALAAHPFRLGKTGFVAMLGYDMYGLYDRAGEGVMYEIEMTLMPSFFSASLGEAWSAKHVKIEAVGFRQTVDYLKSCGASPKAWEKAALSRLADPDELVEMLTTYSDGGPLTVDHIEWLEENDLCDAAMDQLPARVKKMAKAH